MTEIVHNYLVALRLRHPKPEAIFTVTHHKNAFEKGEGGRDEAPKVLGRGSNGRRDIPIQTTTSHAIIPRGEAAPRWFFATNPSSGSHPNTFVWQA